MIYAKYIFNVDFSFFNFSYASPESERLGCKVNLEITLIMLDLMNKTFCKLIL